jgi:hypothetical protein
MPHRAERPDGVDGARPEWFAAFLADRGTRKPSAHTLKAYRQDFDAIATLVAGDWDGVSRMSLGDITTDSLRTAFAPPQPRPPRRLRRSRLHRVQGPTSPPAGLPALDCLSA